MAAQQWTKAAGEKLLFLFLGAALATASSFYLQSHLQPKLTAQIGFAEVLVMPLEKHPNELIANLVDFSSGHLNVIGSEKLTFETPPTVDRVNRYFRITKILIRNTGWTTARNVTMGFGVPVGVIAKVYSTPNAPIASDQLLNAEGENPKFERVRFERLPKNDAVVITVITVFQTSGPTNSKWKSLTEREVGESWYEPLLYLSSDEVAAQDSEATAANFADLTRIEHGIDASDIPFWRYAVVRPESVRATHIQSMALNYSVVDSAGRTVESDDKAQFHRKK